MSKIIPSLLTVVLIMTGCASDEWPEPTKRVKQTAPIENRARSVSQADVDRLTQMCYDRLQKTIGEIRPHRGVIWAECKQDYVAPVEKRLYPGKARQIDAMYDALVADMRRWYQGTTTFDLLERRWQQRQAAIGMRYKETFHDNMLPPMR